MQRCLSIVLVFLQQDGKPRQNTLQKFVGQLVWCVQQQATRDSVSNKVAGKGLTLKVVSDLYMHAMVIDLTIFTDMDMHTHRLKKQRYRERIYIVYMYETIKEF